LILFVAFDVKIDFYTKIYSLTHFYTNVSKHKLLYLQLDFTQNQLYKINSIHGVTLNVCYFDVQMT